ncbi:FMN-binding negative transcriptional regulator [Azorhizophilus paspali]|uniref:FMN-binding negative transcriptional regulator n=1 Tax=Azorhizophilus paspali TaxID=69963 RepID=A0ABV6SG06_AZOPA
MSICPFHYREYRCTDQGLINQFIDTFPLALITSQLDRQFQSSHIPLLRAIDGTLFGHVDRRNPQFNESTRLNCQIVFIGPSSYIPPEGYQGKQLPTWNYLAVHMQAEVEVLHEEARNLEILKQSADQLARQRSAYSVDPQDPRVLHNLPYILGLSIHPRSIEGRFKLSQDKSKKDQEAALEWILEQSRVDHKQLLDQLLLFSSFSANV